MIDATLRQLEYLVAVGKTGTISGAAEMCNVSSVAVGHALTELDRSFDSPLMTRKRSKGAALTPEGLAVATAAVEILRQTAQLPLVARAASTAPKKNLRVGVFAALSSITVPAILRHFSSLHPDVELEFIEGDASELIEKMAEAKVDALVGYRNHMKPHLKYFPVTMVKPSVLVSKDHRLATKDVVTLDDLEGETVALLGLAPARTAVRSLLEAHGLGKTIRWELRNIDTLKSLVGTGLAVAVLFSLSSTPYTANGEALVPLPLLDVSLENALAVFIPDQVHPDVMIERLVTILRGVFDDFPSQRPVDAKEAKWTSAPLI